MEETDTGQTGEEQEVEHQEAAPPSIEEIAKAIGYRSKEEMKDPSKHVDAAEYIKRTAKFNEDYRKEIKNLKKSMDGVTAIIQQTAAAKFDEGVKAAEKRLADAKEAFDVDAIEKAAHEVATAKQRAAEVKIPSSDQAEIDAFCDRNPWFDTSKTMRTDALEYREKFVKRNPDATTAEVLEYVETKIKKDYPDKFQAEPVKEERKPTAAGPEGVSTNNTGSKAAWEKQEKELSDFERNTMEALCKQEHNGKPIMTKKQYIESLAQSGRFGR